MTAFNYKKIQKIAGIVFIISSLVLAYVLLNPPLLIFPEVKHCQPYSDCDGEKQNLEPLAREFRIAYIAMVVSFFTSLGSLIGFLSALVLAWRKENREKQAFSMAIAKEEREQKAFRVDDKKKELENKKLVLEIKELKEKQTKSNSKAKKS